MQSRPTQSEEQDHVQYASVRFMKNQTDPVYSNITPVGAKRQKDVEDENVEYAAVQFNIKASRWAALLTGSMPTPKPQHNMNLEELIGFILLQHSHWFCVCFFAYIFTITAILLHTSHDFLLIFSPLRATGQVTREDPTALYSTINKICWKEIYYLSLFMIYYVFIISSFFY